MLTTALQYDAKRYNITNNCNLPQVHNVTLKQANAFIYNEKRVGSKVQYRIEQQY